MSSSASVGLADMLTRPDAHPFELPAEARLFLVAEFRLRGGSDGGGAHNGSSTEVPPSLWTPQEC